MKDRYYLVFPGYGYSSSRVWDGKEHDIIVKIDQKELELFTSPPPPWKMAGGFPWPPHPRARRPVVMS
ncbi:MAG: hypothetical protein WKG01_38765 [Kofleriaceae bacterium]